MMKKFFLIVGTLIGALLAFLFIKEKIKQALKGKVKVSTSFLPVPGDSGKIYVKNTNTGKWEKARLPERVKFKDVKAAELSQNGNITVEVKHEKIDRHKPGDPVPDSALDKLRGRDQKNG